MSFPDLMNGRGRRCDPEAQGKRQVPLHVENAVFSKLIKLGQKEGKTPARMAQALFEEAYSARCMGKGSPAGEAQAHADFEKLAGIAEEWKTRAASAERERDDLREQLAESGRETARENIEAEEERQAHAATRTALDEARRERDALSQRCWNIERELDELRRPPRPVTVDEPEAGEVPAVAAMVEAVRGGAPILTPPAQFLPCEDGEHNGPAEPDPEPAPLAIGRSTVKAIMMLRGMNETPAEIAKNLALRREIVDQVLRENRA